MPRTESAKSVFLKLTLSRCNSVTADVRQEEIVSRQLLLAAMAVCMLLDAKATDSPLVEVMQLDYRSTSKANDWTGLRLSNAIPPKSVSRVVLIQFEPHRMAGSIDDDQDIEQGHTNRQKCQGFASWIVDTILCTATQSLGIHEKKSWCVPRTIPNGPIDSGNDQVP
jgi:hypothetical protein